MRTKTIEQEFTALVREGWRRGMSYGQLVANTTEAERTRIIQTAGRRAMRKKKERVILPEKEPPKRPEGALAILNLRKKMGLSQAAFAEMAGVSQGTIWRWENDFPPENWREIVERLSQK